MRAYPPWKGGQRANYAKTYSRQITTYFTLSKAAYSQMLHTVYSSAVYTVICAFVSFTNIYWAPTMENITYFNLDVQPKQKSGSLRDKCIPKFRSHRKQRGTFVSLLWTSPAGSREKLKQQFLKSRPLKPAASASPQTCKCSGCPRRRQQQPQAAAARGREGHAAAVALSSSSQAAAVSLNRAKPVLTGPPK